MAVSYKDLQYVKPEQTPSNVHGEFAYGLQKVRHVVAVASGKGGVGKSTVAVNLAVALARQGWKVGLADADIYGPSVPKMTATESIQPAMRMVGETEVLIPVERYGVKWMSVGYFIAPDQPLIWRGPMATNGLRQIVSQVAWGELDVLLVDLPPGTGDIHLSIIHDVKLSGAIVVSTPQAIALADVEKGVNMFLNDKVNVPVLGLVENMAWFTPAELPNNKYYIFGKEGCVELARKFGLPLLAQLPLVQSICESSDSGMPEAAREHASTAPFTLFAERVAEILQL
jgi:ATP-binding protein involved in chromosome partitioning